MLGLGSIRIFTDIRRTKIDFKKQLWPTIS